MRVCRMYVMATIDDDDNNESKSEIFFCSQNNNNDDDFISVCMCLIYNWIETNDSKWHCRFFSFSATEK